MTVQLDGSTLSALLFSHLNSNRNQYGFLVGEKIEHKVDRINDSQIQLCDVNTYIYVSSFIPWPSKDCIYNRSGDIDIEMALNLCSHIDQNIVGWYSFRHNTTSRPSLRERTLHRNLASSKFNGDPEDFLFFLCTSSLSKSLSVYTHNHSFMQNKYGHFKSVSMVVMNLGDTSRKEYIKETSATLAHSKTVQGLLRSSQQDFLKSSGEMEYASSVRCLARSLSESLMTVHGKINESEKILGSLETDVTSLRQQLELLEQEEMSMKMLAVEENKKKEAEENMRKLNEKCEAEEKEQLKKLMTDLSIPFEDDPAGSIVCVNFPPQSFVLFENNYRQIQGTRSTKEHDTASSGGGDRNVGSEIMSCALKLAGDAQSPTEQIPFMNGRNNKSLEGKNVQEVKESSDSLNLLKGGVIFNWTTGACGHTQRSSNADKNMPVDKIHSVDSNKKLKSDTAFLSENRGHSDIQDLPNEGANVVNNNSIPHTDTSEPVNGRMASSDRERVKENEKSQSDEDIEDGFCVVSSSPVF